MDVWQASGSGVSCIPGGKEGSAGTGDSVVVEREPGWRGQAGQTTAAPVDDCAAADQTMRAASDVAVKPAHTTLRQLHSPLFSLHHTRASHSDNQDSHARERQCSAVRRIDSPYMSFATEWGVSCWVVQPLVASFSAAFRDQPTLHSLHSLHRRDRDCASLTLCTPLVAFHSFTSTTILLTLWLLSDTNMIRSVSRAAARLASKPSTLAASTTRTTVLRALVATPTASFASLTPTGTTAPVPTNLRTLKRDISRILDEDTADLAAAPDQGLLEYVKEQGLRITQDKEGLIKLTRTVGDYNITVQFMPEVDEDEMNEEGEAPKAEGEEGEEGKGEGEEEENRLPTHQWEVDIINTVAPQHNTVRLSCITSKQGQYSVEAITFDPQPAPPVQQQQMDLTGVDERKQLYFDELSEGSQDKMFELLESLGVDDKLGQFVQHYAQVVRTQQYLDKLKMLKQFLQQ